MLVAHPAAELFPLIEGAEFQALVEDIRKHGLRDAIITFNGQILDGRNRYRACQEAKREPRFEEWSEDGDVVEYVVSKNLHRRHLNESQRAMIAAKLPSLSKGDVATQLGGVEISTPLFTGKQAAQMLNVDRSTVQYAKVVQREGTEDEVRAVERGEAAVSTIARQIMAKRPPEERKKLRDEPLSQSGRNPERIQRQQINAEIWGRIRDALTHLTSLPQASDVAAIARANDKTGLVEARLQSAIQWLGDFHNEWSKRNAA